MDNKIDSNLDSMSSQLARLRTLGTAIREEVESRNAMLDRMWVKAERSNARVKDQDSQMRKLLGGNVEKEEEQNSAMPTVSKSKMMYSAMKSFSRRIYFRSKVLNN